MVEKHDLHILHVKLSYGLITVAYMNIYPIEHSNSNDINVGTFRYKVFRKSTQSTCVYRGIQLRCHFKKICEQPILVDCG